MRRRSEAAHRGVTVRECSARLGGARARARPDAAEPVRLSFNTSPRELRSRGAPAAQQRSRPRAARSSAGSTAAARSVPSSWPSTFRPIRAGCGQPRTPGWRAAARRASPRSGDQPQRPQVAVGGQQLGTALDAPGADDHVDGAQGDPAPPQGVVVRPPGRRDPSRASRPEAASAGAPRAFRPPLPSGARQGLRTSRWRRPEWDRSPRL